MVLGGLAREAVPDPVTGSKSPIRLATTPSASPGALLRSALTGSGAFGARPHSGSKSPIRLATTPSVSRLRLGVWHAKQCLTPSAGSKSPAARDHTVTIPAPRHTAAATVTAGSPAGISGPAPIRSSTARASRLCRCASR